MGPPPGEFRERLVELLPRLRRFARVIARHRHDADDLVQIAIERALQRWRQWNGESRLDSWMFGIMKNAWIDEVRARARRGTTLSPEDVAEQVGEWSTDAEMEIFSVQQAMAKLPDEQRMVVALVLVEGLSYRETATALDVPIGTVTSRLARAREALQPLLEPLRGAAS